MNEYEQMVRDLIANGPHRVRRQLRMHLPMTRMRYEDLDLLVAPSHNYTEFILWRRGRPPEHAGTMHMRRQFSEKPVTIVDVGANAGIFSLPIAKVADPDSKFVLIEPNPEMITRLRANISLNAMRQVKIAEVAVGDTPGTATLHFSPNNNPGEARLGLAFDTDAGGIEVPVVTLPGLMSDEGITEIDLLKVDVEGLEDRVILPAIRDPKLTIRRIYFEDAHNEHWAEDIAEVLRASGYTEESRFGPNALYALT